MIRNELKIPYGFAMTLITLVGTTPMILHIWTLVIALIHGGPLHAVASLLLPGIAEAYWVAAIWKSSGSLLNPYCIANLAFAALMLFGIIVKKLYTTGTHEPASKAA